ncbi:MAG: methyltransferase domain-containing protein [Erysipelotrichia bacterium]|nr:methyltransferase domain-containing protein [Erysipelotrichia bacterium]
MSIAAKLVLKALETGIIPEKFTRAWVRRLCGLALERASLGDVEARHAVFRQIMKDLKTGTNLRCSPNVEAEGGEMGPEFFELFLGKRLNAGCCYFPTGAEDLEEAEDTMLWMSADRARVRDGMKILEIGCGWGAMTFWLVEHFPQVHITAVTESTSRSIYLQKKANELGLTNIKFLASEFGDLSFSEEFDRIICLERLDLVASSPEWENKIWSWLKPDGKFFLQHQVHANIAYYNESVGLEDFPGNSVVNQRLVVSAEMLMLFQRTMHLEDYWKISGEQYRNTTERWLRRYYFNRQAILPLFEKVYGKKMAWTWLQRWRMFLIASAEQAGYNRGQDWILGQYLLSRKG